MRAPVKPIPTLDRNRLERLWSRVVTRGSDECWPWVAGRAKDGRGRIRIGHATYFVPRVVYAIVTGQDPGTAEVCHSCDNPNCCNPAHLWLGDDRDNQHDRNIKGRTARGERSNRTSLTADMVRQIRASTLASRTAARVFGVRSKSTILRIRHRETWKHVV
jgi:hypothetical protein